MSQPNLFERLFGALFGLVAALIAGILRAPLIALRRMLAPVRVEQAAPADVIPLRHRVLRPGRPEADAHWQGDREPATRHWVARWGGEVVGVVTVLQRTPPGDDAPGWQLRGMAVAPEVRGRGIGSSMLETVHADVGEPMWCNARTGARGFYDKHGWQAVGEVFDKPGVGPHVQMRWPGPGEGA